jgi:hypothetical protein
MRIWFGADSPSISLLNGKSSLTNTQAIISPTGWQLYIREAANVFRMVPGSDKLIFPFHDTNQPRNQ